MSHVVVCVGTNKGAFLLRSDERRSEWSIEGPILKGWDVRNLTVDMRGDTPTMWAAISHFVYGPSVQRSKDWGKTWEQIENSPKYADGAPGELSAVWTVVPGRDDEPDVLYAGVADAGLFTTTDGGDNWEEVSALTAHPTRSEWEPGAGGMCCHSILVHPTNKKRMWVGISAVGVFRTDDGGASWHVRNEGLERAIEPESGSEIGSCIHCLAIDPKNPDRIFQQNHMGVYKTEDGADTWQRIESGLPMTSCFGFPMTVHPRDTDTVYVIPQESGEYRFAPDGLFAVYKSVDAGGEWIPRTDGLPQPGYVGVLRQAMSVDTLNPCGVYFGTAGGEMYASTDEGETWFALPGRYPRISGVNAYVVD